MKLLTIETVGHEGDCWAGLKLRIKVLGVPLPWLKFFWPEYFAQGCARQHDEDCDLIDWNANPETAIQDYQIITDKFHSCSLAAAANSDNRENADIAFRIASGWGWVRYAAAYSGVAF